MLATQKQMQEILNDQYGSFVNKTIHSIRPLKESEISEIGWDGLVGFNDIPMAIVFTDGQVLIPSQDPEANGPGFLLTADLSK
jgi:hypothetical protein